MKDILKLKPSEWLFLLSGLLLQVIVFLLTENTLLSFACGLSGVCSVVLCSQRKLTSFFFGFLQISLYLIISFREKLYGQCAQNLFYFISMVVGLILWIKNYNSEESQVEARSLSKKLWIIIATIFVVSTLGTYWGLAKTNDGQPFVDALSTVPAFIAQILMITRFKEQWIFWIIVDVTALILWINAKDWCMATQFAFWIITCVYGFFKWSE